MLKVDQKKEYLTRGFLSLGSLFSSDEVNYLRRVAHQVELGNRPLKDANICDLDTGLAWRSYALHRDFKAFDIISRLPRILSPVQSLLGSSVYIFQTHMNHKAAKRGEEWSWHQDYANWRLDGLPSGAINDCISVMIMLDDCTEDNGPVQVIAGSHIVHPETGHWDYSGKFKLMAVSESHISQLLSQGLPTKLVGSAGTVVLFSGLLVHGSAANQSPRSRCVAYFAYSRDQNRPPEQKSISLRDHISPYQVDFKASILSASHEEDFAQLITEYHENT